MFLDEATTRFVLVAFFIRHSEDNFELFLFSLSN